MPRPDSVIVDGVVRQAPLPAEDVMGANGVRVVLRASGLEYEIIETHCIARGDEYSGFEVGAAKA